ncbi:hypothetical protein FG93_01092 [Bosea sp. LC85]|uniref:hypothetical protein n=1 Tax=Bosea sp. LC85 TaxID=1502851 RepID=UPI0004E290A8|nr:hypothetical protein [Bosea sp. LC85]KFC74506.1 hypothetical protein FG93_01092 [Bosea sp. LC85]
MANPFDQFDRDSGSYRPLVVTVAPNRTSTGNPFDQVDADPAKDVVVDVAKSGGSGLVRGTTGLLGTIGDGANLLGNFSDDATNWLRDKAIDAGGGALVERFWDPLPPRRNAVADFIGSENINRGVDAAAATLGGSPVTNYKPKTIAGKYTQTVGEFIPGALAGPGGVTRNAVVFGVLPGLASEAAGQATKGSAVEPYARAAAAAATGGVAAVTAKPATAEALIARQMRGIDAAIVDAAGELMKSDYGRKISLTLPEALAFASNGRGKSLIELQRLVEDSRGGGGIMENFMARRPAQVEAAAEHAFDTIAPQSRSPSMIGPDIGQAAKDTIQEATEIIGKPSQGRSYEALRRQYLEPLLRGPLGKLANRDIETLQAIEALFPSGPMAGSAGEIADAVGALAQRNPMAARQLVRAHVESVFSQATPKLRTAADQFGGANFVTALRGNTPQAENLAAAIKAVAGPEAFRGFDEFLNVLSATGQRQRIGAPGALSKEVQDALKGAPLGEAANVASNAIGFKPPKVIAETYENWQLGRNTEKIAELITDPNALPLFRRLAKADPGSIQSQALAARLVVMAIQSTFQAR